MGGGSSGGEVRPFPLARILVAIRGLVLIYAVGYIWEGKVEDKDHRFLYKDIYPLLVFRLSAASAVRSRNKVLYCWVFVRVVPMTVSFITRYEKGIFVGIFYGDGVACMKKV
jgi:hypothetical protein